MGFFEPTSLDVKPPTAEERESKPAGIISRLKEAATGPNTKDSDKKTDVGDVLMLDQYRSVADYKAQQKTEVTFKVRLRRDWQRVCVSPSVAVTPPRMHQRV